MKKLYNQPEIDIQMIRTEPVSADGEITQSDGDYFPGNW